MGTAVFDIKQDYGGTENTPAGAYTVTNLRFRTDDANDQDLLNPIPIVQGQTKRSFWKSIYLQCTTAPGTQVNNVKIYTDESAFATGVTVYVGDETPEKNSGSSAGYDPASGTVGDTGDELTTHVDISAKTDFFTYGSGDPKSITISESGNIIDGVGDTCNYIVLQMDIADTASPGTLSQETWTYQYDEV